jgi:regulator of sigma E protease
VPPAQRRALTEPGALATGIGFRFIDPVVLTVRPDGAAAAAGIKTGDEVVRVDGQPATDFLDFQRAIRAHAGTPLTLSLRRDGAERTLTVTPRVVADPQAQSGAPIGQLGVEPMDPRDSASPMRTLERYGPLDAVGAALDKTASTTGLTLKLLWRMLTGRVSIKNVSGPIGIATFAGLSALGGPLRFIEFLALISISLGILNLMPIPILDGGQVVYQLAERIAGRPLPERVQALGQQVGIVLLILLMSLAFYNDIAWRFG